jgi:hypothetical protein
MKAKLFIVATTIILSSIVFKTQAQNNVGIGTNNPNPSAKLDITANDKGVLIPRLTSAQRLSIVNPATGLLVYDTDQKVLLLNPLQIMSYNLFNTS